jgi:tetratricopeptide (TPR) repeat protein
MADDADSDESASTALRVLPEPASRLQVARSLADAAPGEMVVIDRHGRSISARQFNRVTVVSWVSLVATGAFVGVVYGALISPLVGVLSGVAVELITLFRMRHWPAYRAAFALAASHRWEDAHAALLALEQKSLPAAQRMSAQVLLAELDALLGRPQEALNRLQRTQPDRTTWRRRYSHVVRCQAAWVRAGALATLDRFDEAARARDELLRESAAATGGSGRPRGDYFEMLVQGAELTIAAASDRPELLPDDDTLHRWARAALGRTSFGEILVSLAWAYRRRGDDDMARHLLAEAPSRIPRWSLDKTIPRLDAWARAIAQTWQIKLPTPPIPSPSPIPSPRSPGEG